MLKKLIGASALAIATAAAPIAASADGKYDGVTVNILTRPGPVIAGRLVERAEEFKAMTGAEIRVGSSIRGTVPEDPDGLGDRHQIHRRWRLCIRLGC